MIVSKYENSCQYMAILRKDLLCSACPNIRCERKYGIYILLQIAYIYN